MPEATASAARGTATAAPAAATATPGARAPRTEEGSQALLRRLEWTVLRRLDGLLQGDWRTLRRGHGVDLADLREYQVHTMYATSTGTSLRGCRCRMCASSQRTAT